MWHVCPARDLDVTNKYDVILAVENAYRDMMPRTINGLGLSALDKINSRSIKGQNDEQKKALLKQKESLKETKQTLLDELRMDLAENIIKKVFQAKDGKGNFNNTIHEELCTEFVNAFQDKIKKLNTAIDQFNRNPVLSTDLRVTPICEKKITYGKAQKIVNMTMKQLYCFDNAPNYKSSVFQHCHIPIDSIILEFFKISVTGGWSGFDNVGYKEVQKKCKEKWEKKTEDAGLPANDDFTKLFFAEFIIWDAGTERKGKKKLNIDSIEISP
jgi:hypothetical protein